MTLRKELGEQNTLAQSRLALAELSLEEGRPDQAEALIRQSIEVFDKAKARDWHASAELLLSRCLAAEQKQEEGRQHLDRAQVLLRNSENRTLLLSAQARCRRLHCRARPPQGSCCRSQTGTVGSQQGRANKRGTSDSTCIGPARRNSPHTSSARSDSGGVSAHCTESDDPPCRFGVKRVAGNAQKGSNLLR